MAAPARLALLSKVPNAVAPPAQHVLLLTSPHYSACCSSTENTNLLPRGSVRKFSTVGSAGAAQSPRRTTDPAHALIKADTIPLSVRWIHASSASRSAASTSGSSAIGGGGGGSGHLDVFELFGLKIDDIPGNGWAIDDKEVKTKWRTLMAVTHPDRMAGKSEQEQQAAAQHSTVVNKAYETLINPLLRAQYLLERHGIEPADEADSLEDSELLMEVLELRERLEDASSEQEAVEVREDNRERLNETLAHLSKAFGSSPPDLEQARKLTVELRYWLNIDKAAREWAPGKRVELQH